MRRPIGLLPDHRRGGTGLLLLLMASWVVLPGLAVPALGIPGMGPIRAASAGGYLALSSNSSITATSTQNSSSSPPIQKAFPCGFNAANNSSQVVASSPSGGGIRVTVGEPSWLQICTSYGHVSESFPAYEVFPVTVYAAPGTLVSLSAGVASPSAAQTSIGVYSNPIWTAFNPLNLTTDSSGIARSNFTLAGAVMPFVPNDIANVSLPIIATSTSGGQAEAGLPIEFGGSNSGGIDIIHVLQAPGPILFSGGMAVSANFSSQYAYAIVYAPPVSGGAQPMQVTLSVAGGWVNGAAGPLPADVRVSIAHPSFLLYPNQVFYFFVNENNSIAQTPYQSESNFTFAIQESLGGNSYLEPLTVSVQTSGLYGSFGAFPTSSGFSSAGSPQSWPYVELGLVAAAAVVALAFGLLYFRRRRTVPPHEPAQMVRI